MADEMFFSKDEKSLIRGSRSDARTETCRPCLIVFHKTSDPDLRGVVLDVTPRGMLIRIQEPVAINTEVTVQLMRDDHFQKKLSTPHVGKVVRIELTPDGFYDHGLHLLKGEIPKASERPVHIDASRPAPDLSPSRMHTSDIAREHGDRNR